MSIRLYVGNLPKEIERKELQDVFAEMGDAVTTKVITDRKTGKCRGFGFVTVKTDAEADQLIEKYNGFMFKENPLKIEKALPRTKGKGDKPEKAAGEGEASGSGETQEPRQTPAPVTKANNNAGGGGGSSSGGGGGGGGRRSNKSRRNNERTSTSTSSSSQSEAVQPDPRWASELEKLKQMLAAQTNP